MHEVKSKSQESKHLRHPQVGDLHIKFAAFTVNGAPHLQLVFYKAEPASPTAAAFETLRAAATAPKQATTVDPPARPCGERALAASGRP
ncbi:hypothetical protein SCHAM137S_02200 [Streptomyces chartreusis]